MDNFNRFVENAKDIYANKNQFSDQLKLQFINNSILEMSKESFAYDKKLEKLFYTEENSIKKRREYLILAKDNL